LGDIINIFTKSKIFNNSEVNEDAIKNGVYLGNAGIERGETLRTLSDSVKMKYDELNLFINQYERYYELFEFELNKALLLIGCDPNSIDRELQDVIVDANGHIWVINK
jgi:hypothetical protein